jgi:hypothetical protein
MTRERFLSIIGRRGVKLTRAEVSTVFNGKIGNLLTTGNPKTAKGEKVGYLTAILHLMPAVGSGFQVCPKATAGCEAACLNTAGRGGMALDSNGLNTIQRARRRKTYWYFARRDEFLAQLEREIRNHVRNAAKHGLTPTVRLNGTSDILWENVRNANGQTLFDIFPDVQFYDYTKIPGRTNLPANYDLTFSAADGNDADVARAQDDGQRVAAVTRSLTVLDQSTNERSAQIRMRSMTLPATMDGRPVVDGDKSDLRFLDPPDVVVALRAKGRAIFDTTGFVRDVA